MARAPGAGRLPTAAPLTAPHDEAPTSPAGAFLCRHARQGRPHSDEGGAGSARRAASRFMRHRPPVRSLRPFADATRAPAATPDFFAYLKGPR